MTNHFSIMLQCNKFGDKTININDLEDYFMKRLGNFYSTYSLYINAALLATHTNHYENGFRQKDLKFYIELLTNWMETSFRGPGLKVNNNQIKRLLENLLENGFLKKNIKSDIPIYKFHSHGLLEIANRLIDLDQNENIQEFFFLYHFLYLYSSKLQSVFFDDSHQLPPNYQLELTHMFQPESLLQKQQQRIKLLISKLELRIQEAYGMTELAEELLSEGTHFDQIIEKVEKDYPYQLNNQKKMTELFKELSVDIQLVEITQAPKIRAKTLWEPLLQYYNNYLLQLERLSVTR